MKIVAILDLPVVGVAQLLVEILLVGKRLVCSRLRAPCGDRSRRRSPSSLPGCDRVRGRVTTVLGRGRPSAISSGERTPDVGLSEAERFRQKPFLLRRFRPLTAPAREARLATPRLISARRPTGARVVPLLDNSRSSRPVLNRMNVSSESFCHRRCSCPVRFKLSGPERHRPLDRIRRSL